MKIFKKRAFTLAELMVLLAILTVLFAAFAPVFTVRYNNASMDNVWRFIQDDSEYDAYSDVIEKALPAEFFIGIQPTKAGDISGIYSPYSKLVIRSSNNLNGHLQSQIDFRRSGSENLIASLFSGESNFLLGGGKNDLPRTSINKYNTSYGVGALEGFCKGNLCNSGKATRNTAIGYYALRGPSSFVNENNTVVGTQKYGHSIPGDGNTFVGYNTNSFGDENTLVGANILFNGKHNTIVGIRSNSEVDSYMNGDDNTVLGFEALGHGGSGNTAVGWRALNQSGDTSKNNTAIGYKACNSLTRGSNKTCIGQNSGSVRTGAGSRTLEKLLNDDEERVFIGGYPNDITNAVSLLEIHNVGGTYERMYNHYKHDERYTTTLNEPSPRSYNMGNSSVVVNGDLIVRGQFFMPGVTNIFGDPKPSLMAYRLWKPAYDTADRYYFVGYDGSLLDTRFNNNYQHRGTHREYGGNSSCICARGINDNGVRSYDWGGHNTFLAEGQQYGSTYRRFTNLVDKESLMQGKRTRYPYYYGGKYYDLSTNEYINNYSTIIGEVYDKMNNPTDPWTSNMTGIPVDMAHSAPPVPDPADCGSSITIYRKYCQQADPGTCCPDITSDARLKDIQTPFTSGLAQLKKIKIYNYTFKADSLKLPHVGVIAQDLKRIFPNAVSKDESGYYKIRWDEIFYSAINAVKELNAKIENLAQKVANDRTRINNLKKDNAQMEKQLDVLSQELARLEKNK